MRNSYNSSVQHVHYNLKLSCMLSHEQSKSNAINEECKKVFCSRKYKNPVEKGECSTLPFLFYPKASKFVHPSHFNHLTRIVCQG